ncbi:MAG TPA: NAD-dependent epimerase/dehydratase family protein [Opitutaceae bacterium]|nr:NAD-dependent epimerase/dehydratase family protein [Opitutaceae bacterium]
MKVLVTGAAGFIGFHVCQRLAQSRKATVLGLDNLNSYYAVELKRARLAELEKCEDCRFVQADFADATAFNGIYNAFKPDYVVHLGAQAGVRYSLENPAAYVHSNLVGFANVLEAVRRHPPKHLLFASSSSVYGTGAKVPFREDDVTHQPLSFYAATKQANEVMGYSYSRLYGLNLTGLRFFTVYGPWGRPDMTPIIFSRAICAGEPIKLFNHGKYLRDFTYIDDVVNGVLKVLLYPPAVSPSNPPAQPPFRIFNLGHNRPVEMRLFVQMLETLLDRKARIELLPPQPTEMVETCADLTKIRAAVGYEPHVPLEEGLRRFVAWFREYYHPTV